MGLNANICSLSGDIATVLERERDPWLAEQGDDLVPAWAATVHFGLHQRGLGLEEQLTAAVNRSVNPKACGITVADLAQQVDNPAPDGSRDQRQSAAPTLFDRQHQEVRFAELTPRADRAPPLPRPESVLLNLKHGAFDHG